jgi:glyoxylase-like metal-dependent hydrolase (beta-lactamase superfamily II)
MSQSLYRPHYLTVTDLKWKTFNTPTWPLFPGITLHRCPGHTDGLIIAEVKLETEGTVVFTGDLMHVAENYEKGTPQGSLITDFTAWHRSREYVRNLVARRAAKVVLGHDMQYFENFIGSEAYKSKGFVN